MYFSLYILHTPHSQTLGWVHKACKNPLKDGCSDIIIVCDAKPCNMPIHAHFFRREILTREMGHTDLVLGVRSGFVSRSVHRRLQVSVCSG